MTCNDVSNVRVNLLDITTVSRLRQFAAVHCLSPRDDRSVWIFGSLADGNS